MTELGEDILTGSATSLDVSGILATYKDLYIVAFTKSDRSDASTDDIHLTVGNGTVDTGASAYAWHRRYYGSGAGGDVADNADSKIDAGISAASKTTPTDLESYGMTEVTFLNYADTADNRSFTGRTTLWSPADNVKYNSMFWGQWRDASNALDVIKIVPSVGTNFVAGSWVRVYGIGLA